MKFLEYKYLVLSDLYRITGKVRAKTLFRLVLTGETYKYNFWMRTSRFVHENRILKLFFFGFCEFMRNHYVFKFGVSVPFKTEIGSGFYIGHFGGIIVSEKSKIGKNFNISPGVVLGQANRGANKGYPTIGDNVYVGPGAKIIGNVKIGNNVAVGANCVVTKDIPDNSVVIGVPGRIISDKGSKDYVCNTDYDKYLDSGRENDSGDACCA